MNAHTHRSVRSACICKSSVPLQSRLCKPGLEQVSEQWTNEVDPRHAPTGSGAAMKSHVWQVSPRSAPAVSGAVMKSHVRISAEKPAERRETRRARARARAKVRTIERARVRARARGIERTRDGERENGGGGGREKRDRRKAEYTSVRTHKKHTERRNHGNFNNATQVFATMQCLSSDSSKLL